MAQYTLIIDDPKTGIAIMCDEKNTLSAYINGKHYSVEDYRPLTAGGRTLREESQKAISEILPLAMKQFETMNARKAEEWQSLKRTALEEVKKEIHPPKSFAETLEESFLKVMLEKSTEGMVDQIFPEVEKKVVEKFGFIPKIHEIRIPDRPKYETTEVLHKAFDRILNAVMDNEPIYFYGPAGTGKSYLAKQIAKALNIEYYYTNNVTDEVQIKGFIDANGHYHETEFYKAFTNGGVFLLDELDASIPETLTMLNEALANGYFPFPNGKVNAHPDFHCLSAGNTFGTGADNEYTGRFQLDAATLNRFAVIHIDYDERIENSMCNNDGDLVNFAHDFRNAVKDCGVSCLCTYRDIRRLYKFISYMEKAEAIQMGLTKGLPADDIRLIFNKLKGKENEWAKALKSLSEIG